MVEDLGLKFITVEGEDKVENPMTDVIMTIQTIRIDLDPIVVIEGLNLIDKLEVDQDENKTTDGIFSEITLSYMKILGDRMTAGNTKVITKMIIMVEGEVEIELEKGPIFETIAIVEEAIEVQVAVGIDQVPEQVPIEIELDAISTDSMIIL